MSKMLEEIRQQPAALERTLRAELRPIQRFKRRLETRRPRLIVLAARGTSDNAAQFGRYLLEITTGIPVSLAAPSIFTLYRARVDLREAWWWRSRSPGNPPTPTWFWSAPASRARSRWASPTNPRSALARLAEHLFLVRAGKEKSVAATKTYTGQLLMLYLLAYALGARIRLEDLRTPAGMGRRGAGTRAGDRGMLGTLPLHDRGRGGGARAELRQRLRIQPQADGDLLRGGRALFLGGFSARPHRHGRAVFPGVPVRSRRSDLAFHAPDAGAPAAVEGRDFGHHRSGKSGSPGCGQPLDLASP